MDTNFFTTETRRYGEIKTPSLRVSSEAGGKKTHRI